MLSDPLYLGVPNQAAGLMNPAVSVNTEVSTVLVFHQVPSAGGTTKRKAIADSIFSYDGENQVKHEVTLTTGHIASRENAPYETDRTLARLDIKSNPDENGKSASLSAIMTIAVPNGVFTEADRLVAARMLAVAILYGPSTLSNDYTATANDLTLTRLLNGEA